MSQMNERMGSYEPIGGGGGQADEATATLQADLNLLREDARWLGRDRGVEWPVLESARDMARRASRIRRIGGHLGTFTGDDLDWLRNFEAEARRVAGDQ